MDIFSAIDFIVEKSGVLFWISLLVFIALIIRAIALWYWRVNKIVELLEKIESNTRKESASDPTQSQK